jgi:hypothetical protein
VDIEGIRTLEHDVVAGSFEGSVDQDFLDS